MIRKLSALLMFFALIGTSAKASHISGGEIIYTCLGNNMYEVTLILYRDCDGISMPSSNTLDFDSPCGSQTATLGLTNGTTGTEISQLCPSVIPQSTCNGGSLPGMQAYFYTDTVTLLPCDSWTMSWDVCCRNAAILNLTAPDTQSGYIEATMNNQDFPCNNSPSFTGLPIPYVCQNQPVNFSYGAIDTEGDSLSYSLINAMDVGGAPLAYNAPYTPTQPVTGVTNINQFTGLLTFTPTQLGNFVFVVLIEQFDSQGNLIGTIMRDMQFVVIACSNNQPDPNDGDMMNFSGTANQLDSMSIVMCASGAFCYDFIITDPDLQDTITLTSNVSQVLAGATFTYTGTNPVSGTLCWNGVPGSEGLNSFIITANDGQCPIPAIQNYVYDVFVLFATSAGPDQIICGPQSAQLQAVGGTIFNWTAVPGGDPINVNNFTCTQCEDPVATPSITTSYIVTSNLMGSCSNIDTVTVFVVPDFTFTATQSDTLICLGETVSFDVTNIAPAGAGYTFLWTPSTGLTNPNVANPTGIYGNPGTYDYVVEISSPDGCIHLDTNLTVTVSPGYIPIFSVNLQDSMVCQGGSTQVGVTLDCTLPSFCGLYNGPCCGPVSITDAGTGTQQGTGTSFPAIYGNWWEGAKHQILYRASELQALSFSGGLISEIGFNIGALNGTSIYHEWEIKMGCTTLNELNGTSWVNGLTSVFYADTINIQTGWNTYQFPESFNWDGNSNLIIEICFNNTDFFGFTNNSPTLNTVTPFNSVMYYNADNDTLLCSTAAIDAISDQRPNTRFIFCGGINQSSLAYQWSPSGDFADPLAQTTTVTPSSAPTQYTITVGELGSGCNASETFTIGWLPGPSVSFVPVPDEGIFPFTPTFNNTSDPSVIGFSWDFSGLGSSTDPDPNFTFDQPGTYYITLTGTDQDGCFGTYTDSIVVLREPLVVIPNVVSPNGDGSNDFFAFVEFQGFKEFSMKIFDRWGKMVTETSNVGSDLRIWRPESSAAEGTYFYIFTGTGSNGLEFERTGHITLLR